MIDQIKTSRKFEDILKNNRFVFIDWYAKWCGPCKRIAPFLEKLNENNEELGVKFIKIDVEDCEDLSANYGITGMPTFHLFKEGQIIETIVGADQDKIVKLFEKWL